MRLYVNNIVGILFFITCIVYLGCVLFGFEYSSEFIRSFIAPLLLLSYLVKKLPKVSLFLFFLIFYALAETAFLFQGYPDFSYYLSNASYILAYSFMLAFILQKIQFSKMLKRFSKHLMVLLFFGGYLVFALDKLSGLEASNYKLLDYILYTTYNALFILVLIFSLINYLYHDTKKSLNLFLACLFIALSELVQVADIVEMKTLFLVLYSFLLVLGFCLLFFYFSFKDNTKSIDLETGLIDS